MATADAEADLPFMAGDEGRLESDCTVERVVNVERGEWKSTDIQTRNWSVRCITQGMFEDMLTICEILLACGSKRNVTYHKD